MTDEQAKKLALVQASKMALLTWNRYHLIDLSAVSADLTVVHLVNPQAQSNTALVAFCREMGIGS